MEPAIQLSGSNLTPPSGDTASIEQTGQNRTPGKADTFDFHVDVLPENGSAAIRGIVRATYETIQALKPDPTGRALEQLQQFADEGNLKDGFVLQLLDNPFPGTVSN